MENEKIIKEEPEIKSAYNVSGLRKLRHEVKALKQNVDSYVKAGKPLPPKLKARLATLRTNMVSLSRLEAGK